MMYAIVSCPGCSRERVIDLSANTSVCPYCGRRSENGVLAVRFQHRDQNIVRDVFQGKEDVPLVKDGERPDPMDSLRYTLSHINDPERKMAVAAENLDRIKGEFTLEDIEYVLPGQGERYAEAMLESCLIHEVGYGRYRI